MKLSRRQLLTATGLIGISATLTACGGSEQGGSASGAATEIRLAITQAADSSIRKKFATICKDFTKENPDIKVTLDPASNNYEADMKVKMAANDLPDIFATHGWSVKRYSAFLVPLQDEEWAKRVNPLLDSSMKNDKGELFAFPTELDIFALTYNSTVLEQAGVKPEDIKTWDDFAKACDAILAKGKTPIFAYGKNAGYPGNLINQTAHGFYSPDDLKKLQEGTFPEAPWKNLIGLLDGWVEAGYFNKDFSSATSDDASKALAQDLAGFVIDSNSTTMDALGYNPDAKLGYMRFPAPSGIEPYAVGGEGQTALGISKKGKVDAAKKFLAYLAKPEVAASLVAGSGSPSGLKDVEADLGTLKSSYEKVNSGGELKPYFDRTYMPNGMWSAMCTAVDSIITGQGTVESTTKTVSAEFKNLYGQKS